MKVKCPNCNKWKRCNTTKHFSEIYCPDCKTSYTFDPKKVIHMTKF